MLGARRKKLAWWAAHQAGALPPTTVKAGRPLTLLADAHFTRVCPRLEALPRLILPAPMLTARALRTAVAGPLLGPDAGADTLDLGTSDDALVTHAGGTGAVRWHPATPFRMLLPTSEAACASRTAGPWFCDLVQAGQGRALKPRAADLAGQTAAALTAALGSLKLLPILVLPALREAAATNRAEAGAWRRVSAGSRRAWLLLAAHRTFLTGAEGAGGVKGVRKGLSKGSSDPMVQASLAGWTAVLGYDEWMAAGWRLTGPAGASHEASKAGA